MESAKREHKADFLVGAPQLAPFMAHAPLPHTDLAELLSQRRAAPVDRATLADELIRQNAHLPTPAAVLDNIHALRQPDTFTVTTGHQLCWMGGPMFTLHKISTAISLAAYLQERLPGTRVVPVFWMATEDHDWEEINHYYPGGGRKVTYAAKNAGPVGRHILLPEAADAFAESAEQFRDFYQPGISMAEAFRQFIHHLFGAQGLVIIDADRPLLKRLFLPHLASELRSQTFSTAISAQTARLTDAGYEPPARPRDINLFYMGHGGRSGIQLDGAKLTVPDARMTWTPDEAAAHAAANPEHFSPNVLFRPLYQEAILPNLAYVGGWAEVGYWLQLRSAFALAGIPMPLLHPRMSATLYTAEIADEAESLGIPLDGFSAPLNELQEQYLLRHWDPAPLQASMSAVLSAYDGLANNLDALDPTLGTSMRGERARTQANLDNLLKKAMKALRNRNPKPYAAIANLKNTLAPEQDKQERVLNFTAFPVAPHDIIAALLRHCNPEAHQEQWIKLP